MKLYLMRHGETLWNKARRLQGCSDIELNDNGVALAKAVGEKLKDVTLHRAFTSPLKRAVDTARYVLGERDVPLVVDERIKEISFGVWEGCCILEDQAEVPLDEFRKFIQRPSIYQPPVDGESIESLYTRTGLFIRELLETPAYQEETILVTAHGAAVRAMMYNLLPVPLDEFWRGSVPPNCSLNIFEISSGEVIDFQGDVTYEQL